MYSFHTLYHITRFGAPLSTLVTFRSAESPNWSQQYTHQTRKDQIHSTSRPVDLRVLHSSAVWKWPWSILQLCCCCCCCWLARVAFAPSTVTNLRLPNVYALTPARFRSRSYVLFASLFCFTNLSYIAFSFHIYAPRSHAKRPCKRHESQMSISSPGTA